MRILHFSFRQFFILLNLTELEKHNYSQMQPLLGDPPAEGRPGWGGGGIGQGGGQKEVYYPQFEKNNLEGKHIYNEISGLM